MALFQTVDPAARRLTGRVLQRRVVLAMIKRRAAAAGLPPSTCCHTFRATGITAYLSNGGTLEHAQQIAGHASPKTTKALRPDGGHGDGRRDRAYRDLNGYGGHRGGGAGAEARRPQGLDAGPVSGRGEEAPRHDRHGHPGRAQRPGERGPGDGGGRTTSRPRGSRPGGRRCFRAWTVVGDRLTGRPLTRRVGAGHDQAPGGDGGAPALDLPGIAGPSSTPSRSIREATPVMNTSS